MSATLLKNGLIVDGQLNPPRLGDVLFNDDRILAIAPCGNIHHQLIQEAKVGLKIDCQGKVISPGFIDVHTHDDAAVIEKPDMLPKISQGVTSVIVGNCGISLIPIVTDKPPQPLSLLGHNQFKYQYLSEYIKALQHVQPAVNVGVLIGHTALRIANIKNLQRVANDKEISGMCAQLSRAMDEGALGVSSGVFYHEAFAANIDELVKIVSIAGNAGGVYASHIRDETAEIVAAINEAADTAFHGKIRLIISHHKCAGPTNWGRARETLALIEGIAKKQDLAMDVYPYTAGSTVIREDLLKSSTKVYITASKMYPEMQGRYLGDIAKEWAMSENEACRKLIPGGACYFLMDEADVEKIVSHPMSMIGSDGLPHDERPHPRLYGAFPKVLATYWREKKLLNLENFIYKMSGLSAQKFNIANRGVLKEGNYADIVVFDPQRVKDCATYDNPQQLSQGIEYVWVNGKLSYNEANLHPISRNGRFLKRKNLL